MRGGAREAIRSGVALLVLATLIGFVAWHRRAKFAKDDADEKGKKVLVADLEATQRIVVEASSGKLVLVRRSKEASGTYMDIWAPLSLECESISEWEIVEPFRALPDYYSASTFLENLKELTWSKVIREKGEKPEDYGLAPAALAVSLWDKAGKLQQTIKLGEQNSASSGLYLQSSTSPKIVLSAMTMDYLKTRPPSEWRRKEILGFKELGKVRKIYAEYADGGARRKFGAERSNGKWALVHPAKLPADDSKVDNLLSNLKSMRAMAIESEDGTKQLAKYGFDKPYAVFRVTFDTSGGPQERTVEIGSKIEKEKDLYVRRLDYPQIYTVRNTYKEMLTLSLSDVVNKQPFVFKKEAVTSLVVESADRVIEVTKKGKTWWLGSPVEDAADDTRVGALLSKLMDLKAAEYLEMSPASKKATPFLKIRLTAEGKNQELVLEKDAVNVIGRASGMTFWFDEKSIEGINSDVDQLRDARLIPFEPFSLASIRYKKGSLEARFKKGGDGKWLLESLDGSDASLRKKIAGGGSSLAETLERTNLKSFAVHERVLASDPSAFELEAKSDLGGSVSWLFGRTVGDDRLVMNRERDVVGRIPTKEVEEIERVFRNG